MFRAILVAAVLFTLSPGAQAQFLQYDYEQALLQHKQRIARNHLAFLKNETLEQSPRRAFDVHYYGLEIRTDYPNRQIHGRVVMKAVSLADNFSGLTLDMYEGLQLDSLCGDAVSFRRSGNYIDLQLSRQLARGESFRITIDYHGNPETQEASWFRFDQLSDGSPHIWTQSEPYGARYWWPCKDTPTDKADSMDIYITVPDDELAGSNGTLVSVTENDDHTKTFHWHEQYPIATYLVSLAIGQYAHFQDYYHYSDTDSMLLDYYVDPQRFDLARELFAHVPDHLDALSHYFGPYPFLKEKYGMAQYNWGGAMEHQTLTSIGRVQSGYWMFIYVHELAHQWFGDAVTCGSWQDIWLNEGFATYSEALYAEWAGFAGLPPGEEALHEYMVYKRYGEQKDQDKTVFVEDTSLVGNIFDRVVYYKGAWILHMLRHVVGDETFFDILKSYVSDPRWRYASVRTENFKTVCEEKSGMDLSAFFEQWLKYPYFPRYTYSWAVISTDQNSCRLKLNIEQIQQQPVYRMPIDVAFYFGQGQDTTLVLQNTRRSQDYVIILNREPQAVALDPKNWILRQVSETPARSYSAMVTFDHVFPNPFRDYIYIHTINWNPKQPELYVYNVLGQKIKKLLPREFSHYNYYYRWYGYNELAHKMPPGIYFLKAPDEGQAYKIVLLP